MKRYLIGGVVAVIVLAVVRHFYLVHEQNVQMDEFVDARLSENLQVPLDCPPLGKQPVTFIPDDSTTELTSENMPTIVNQWGDLWPAASKGIQNAEKDDKKKAALGQNPEIHVVLPGALLSANPKWSIEYTCVSGSYTVLMTGMKVTSAATSN